MTGDVSRDSKLHADEYCTHPVTSESLHSHPHRCHSRVVGVDDATMNVRGTGRLKPEEAHKGKARQVKLSVTLTQTQHENSVGMRKGHQCQCQCSTDSDRQNCHC